jgi:DNA-binding transcriptional MerR regulator
MNNFSIRDIENLSGIKAHTIRIWEQRYGFLKPKRTDTNIRWYCNEELKTILNIALLTKYGYRISQIDKMDEVQIRENVLSLDCREACQERMINELLQAMVDLDMDSFENSIDHHIEKFGMENTVLQLIFPFLEKIGLLWQTGRIIPAQEHLVSNLIRQKLVVAIDTLVPRRSIPQSFLLFLPEGEHHEMGILFMHFLLKTRGANIIYLGANVPVRDLGFLIKTKKPDYIYSHLTSPASSFNFERFLKQLTQLAPGNILISGLTTRQYKKTPPPGIEFKTSLAAVMEWMEGLVD